MKNGIVVHLYKNSYKSSKDFNIYSLRSKGLIIGHTSLIYLKDVSFHVSEKGRKRVLKEKRKNVHAYIKGTICCDNLSVDASKEVTYNPYLNNSFMCNNQPIHNATGIVATKLGIYLCYHNSITPI